SGPSAASSVVQAWSFMNSAYIARESSSRSTSSATGRSAPAARARGDEFGFSISGSFWVGTNSNTRVPFLERKLSSVRNLTKAQGHVLCSAHGPEELRHGEVRQESASQGQ